MTIGIGIGNSFGRKKSGSISPPLVKYLYARFRSDSPGATGGPMNLSEIWFHNEEGPIAYSGETFGSGVTSGNLYDGNPDSRVQLEVGGWAAVGFTKPEVITKMVFRQGQWGESAKSGYVEGSNDKITWDTLRYIPDMTTGDFNVSEYVISGATEQKLRATVSQAALIAATLTRSIRLQASVAQSNTTIGDFKILPKNLKISRLLLVAGGGGASTAGGGAGGLIEETAPFSLEPGAYPVVVGPGGAGAANISTLGTNGSNSTFAGRTAIGGGGGGSTGTDGNAGGSGGGGGSSSSRTGLGGNGTTNQGNRGGNSGFISGTNAGRGGGGGAGAVGGTGSSAGGGPGGAGGAGKASDISGVSTYYAGGGSGQRASGTGYTPGGIGGGGAGGDANGGAGTNGLGGGGGGGYSVRGGGGSGIVIIRYAGPPKATGGTITTVGTDTVHTFTSSGTFTVTL